MKVLLTGASGQLGRELALILKDNCSLIATSRSDTEYVIDLNRPDSICNIIREIKPDVVVNAAAYTDVERAEQEYELAMNINGIAPGIIAEEAKTINAALIHFSTDFVFDGMANHPYTEQDVANPLSTYGKSKLAGEKAIEEVNGSYIIFRTAWLYSMQGRNFLTTIRKLAIEKEELNVVNDQIGSPTWCRSIANLTNTILFNQNRSIHDLFEKYIGTYHATSDGSCSWYDFACVILENLKKDGHDQVANVKPVSSADYSSKVKRPAYSVLDNSKLFKTFNIKLPNWKDALEQAWNK